MANNSRVNLRRKITDGIASMLCVAAVIIVVAPLCAIFFYLIVKGAGSLNLAFLTHTPKPACRSGYGVAGAACHRRSCARVRNPAVAEHALHHLADGAAGSSHGIAACVCPSRRRDGAVAIHGVWQPVLEFQA